MVGDLLRFRDGAQFGRVGDDERPAVPSYGADLPQAGQAAVYGLAGGADPRRDLAIGDACQRPVPGGVGAGLVREVEQVRRQAAGHIECAVAHGGVGCLTQPCGEGADDVPGDGGGRFQELQQVAPLQKLCLAVRTGYGIGRAGQIVQQRHLAEVFAAPAPGDVNGRTGVLAGSGPLDIHVPGKDDVKRLSGVAFMKKRLARPEATAATDGGEAVQGVPIQTGEERHAT